MTQLPAREYLRSELRPALFRLVLPAFCAPVLHLMLIPLWPSGAWNRTGGLAVHVMAAVLVAPLAIWGAGDTFARMCRHGRGGGAATVGWAMLTVGVNVGVVVGGTFLWAKLGALFTLLLGIALIPVVVDLVVFGMDRWRDAVQLYYRFE